MEKLVFKPTGVCSKEIEITIHDGIIQSVHFEKGCEGNLKGIGRLVEGMPVQDVVHKLKGIDCRGMGTSCPDQLAKGLESVLPQQPSVT